MYFSLCEFSHAISDSLISAYRNHIWAVIQTPGISYKDKCSLVPASGRVLDSSCECGFLLFLCDIWSCVKQRNKIHCNTQEVLNNPQMYELPARQCVPVTTGTSGASSRISPWLLSSSQGSFLHTMVRSLYHLSWDCQWNPFVCGLLWLLSLERGTKF